MAAAESESERSALWGISAGRRPRDARACGEGTDGGEGDDCCCCLEMVAIVVVGAESRMGAVKRVLWQELRFVAGLGVTS